MKHLTSLKELSKDEILELLDLADNFIDSEGFIRRDPLFPDKKVINIFCEPSTRTKISFEIAASNLGCQVIDFDVNSSSLEKGETLKDTIDNFFFDLTNHHYNSYGNNILIYNTILYHETKIFFSA